MHLALALALLAVIEVPWSESPQVLAGKYVAVELVSGTRLEGYWASVSPDSFVFKVEKTSDKRALPKGAQKIPRSSIAVVKARRRSVRGRTIGTISGFLLGGVLLAAGMQEALLLAPYGLATAGFFVGRSIDHAMQPVVFLPDEPSALP